MLQLDLMCMRRARNLAERCWAGCSSWAHAADGPWRRATHPRACRVTRPQLERKKHAGRCAWGAGGRARGAFKLKNILIY